MATFRSLSAMAGIFRPHICEGHLEDIGGQCQSLFTSQPTTGPGIPKSMG